jgi:hypothetical protein
MENPEEMGKFLDMHDQAKLSQENINYLSRFITSNEIEAAIKNHPKQKSPGPDRFSAEFFQIFKEVLIPKLLKIFYEI